MCKVRIIISTRQGMLRKYLLVCRHLMNKLELESISKLYWLVFWADQALPEFDSFEIITADATDEKKLSWRNFSFDFVQTFLVLSGTAERPWGSKIFNWQQQEAKISFFFRRHFVSFQLNCIALRRSILISIEHARTFSISINGTAFPGLCSNFTEFFQTRFQC